MPYAEECEPPFYDVPMVLLKPNYVPSIACIPNAINTLVRGSILILVICVLLGFIYGPSIFLFGLVLIAALYGPSLYATLIGKAPEGFQAEILRGKSTDPKITNMQVNVIGAPTETAPSAKNPFMNILIDELKYNPSRPPAKDINDPLVKTQLDDFFRIQWVSDPTDVFGRSQSQREFYTMPSTSVPNDQASYQDWLYKIPGKTCKEGGRDACLPGTDGSPVSWLNADR